MRSTSEATAPFGQGRDDLHDPIRPARAWDRFHAAQKEVLGWTTGSERFAREERKHFERYQTYFGVPSEL